MGEVPEAAEVLGRELPMVPSTATAFTVATMLQSACDDIRASRHLVTLSLTGLGMLRGQGLGALIRFLTEDLVAGSTRVIDDLDAASQSFARFARTCEVLDDVARVTLRECGEALEAIRHAWSQLGDASAGIGPAAILAVPTRWRAAPPDWLPEESLCLAETPGLQYARSRWGEASREWRYALEEVARTSNEWERLVHERRTAEQQLAVALDGSLLLTSYLTPAEPHGSRAHLTRSITGLAVHPGRRAPQGEEALLAQGALSASEAARVWSASQYAKMGEAELRALPLEIILALAGAPGVPSQAQNVLARAALEGASRNPELAYRVMGFAGSGTSVTEFSEQLITLTETLVNFDSLMHQTHSRVPVQLLGFGNHDDALTATIALGDLDTATHIGVNVSGMFSDTDNMGSTLGGVKALYGEAESLNLGHSYALAHWIGYDSPGILPGNGGVLALQRAQSGGYQLGQFLDGVIASREAQGAPPPEHTSVLGHSYGSTTAVEAAKVMHHTVDHLVTYGSAGVHVTSVDGLNARAVSATSAKGDQVAWAGIVGGGRRDPRALEGVHVFSSEAVEGHKRVTMHDMYATPGSSSFVNPVKRGYLSEGTHSVAYMARTLAGREASQ